MITCKYITQENQPRLILFGFQSRPDPTVLAKLAEKIAELETELEDVAGKLATATGDDRLQIQHHYYVLKREATEYELSLLLNRRKQVESVPPSHDYLYEPDPEIADLGLKLNRLRIKRRIFDYIIAALSP